MTRDIPLALGLSAVLAVGAGAAAQQNRPPVPQGTVRLPSVQCASVSSTSMRRP